METKKWLALLGCLVLSMNFSTAVGELLPGGDTQAYVNFGNANISFLAVDQSQPDAGQTQLSVVDQGGIPRAKVEVIGEGTPYLIVDVASLLGEAAARLHRIELAVEVENPGGSFYAVSGEISAYRGAEKIGKACSWSVYLGSKNPNTAKFTLGDAGIPLGELVDVIVVSKKVDNAIEAGEAPSHLLLHEIRFFDQQENLLPVNENATLHLPEGFGGVDRTNLLATVSETPLGGAAGASSGWGQAVALAAVKNGGDFDPGYIVPGSIITAYYTSATPPELILQSWTEGAPEQAGWAKVAAAVVNDSGTLCQFLYDDMVTAFGCDDFAGFLDQLYIGDTGEALTITAATIGLME